MNRRENGGILPQDREMEGVSPNADDHRTRTTDPPPQPGPLSVPVDRVVRRFAIGDSEILRFSPYEIPLDFISDPVTRTGVQFDFTCKAGMSELRDEAADMEHRWYSSGLAA